jgi:hypothetical protein
LKSKFKLFEYISTKILLFCRNISTLVIIKTENLDTVSYIGNILTALFSIFGFLDTVWGPLKNLGRKCLKKNRVHPEHHIKQITPTIEKEITLHIDAESTPSLISPQKISDGGRRFLKKKEN